MPNKTSGTQRLHKLEGVKKSDNATADIIDSGKRALRKHSSSYHTLYASPSWIECARSVSGAANSAPTEQMPQWILFPEC